MNKEEIYRLLDEKGIRYEITEHEAVFNMEELAQLKLPYPEADAKNLFVRDDKKQQYYLITVKGDKRVDLKEFRIKNGTRHLSFASAGEMQELLQLTPGSVTPFGMLNDAGGKVTFYLDDYFLHAPERIGCHPNENTATVWLAVKDLIAILEEHGSPVHIVEI